MRVTCCSAFSIRKVPAFSLHILYSFLFSLQYGMRTTRSLDLLVFKDLSFFLHHISTTFSLYIPSISTAKQCGSYYRHHTEKFTEMVAIRPLCSRLKLIG